MFLPFQAEEADFTADLHGHWKIENAKSRLHQFLQQNKIRTDYKYQMIGPDHNRYAHLFFVYLSHFNLCTIIFSSQQGLFCSPHFRVAFASVTSVCFHILRKHLKSFVLVAKVISRRGSRILVRGGQWTFDPRGGLSPKFAQNRGFSLKIA